MLALHSGRVGLCDGYGGGEMSTTEILKAHAPEFVALDEAEGNAPRETWYVGATPSGGIGLVDRCPPTEFGRSICIMSGVDEDFLKRAELMALAGNKTRALLDAYAQALLKLAEREWRPIETAPKDGTSIWAWDGEGCFIAYFDQSDLQHFNGWHVFNNGDYFEAGYGKAYKCGACEQYGLPIQWQPLSPPPGQKGEV